jgi:ABC-type polysaccharide/polyol phosphate export permease
MRISETFRSPSRYELAAADILQGLGQWRLWLFLSWQDIKLRYRRSTLGPFWITLSMAITIYTIGLLYGKLLKMDLKLYYPFLAAGMLTWNLISTLVVDGMNIFTESESFLKQMKKPYSTFIFRVISRNFILFFHNVIVIVPIIIIFHVQISWHILLLPVSLFIIWLNAAAYTTIFSMLGTRFRDLTQVITSLMQVAFFISPVMWSPQILPERYKFVVDINPFAQFIEIIREPLLGRLPSLYTMGAVLLITLVGLTIAFLFFAKYRARIVYWL